MEPSAEQPWKIAARPMRADDQSWLAGAYHRQAVPGMLDNKVAIVTGGGRGIGARYCRGLAAEGARVVVADIEAGGAERVANEVDGLACRVDVADPASVQAMVTGALQTYGGLDIP